MADEQSQKALKGPLKQSAEAGRGTSEKFGGKIWEEKLMQIGGSWGGCWRGPLDWEGDSVWSGENRDAIACLVLAWWLLEVELVVGCILGIGHLTLSISVAHGRPSDVFIAEEEGAR